MSNTAAGVKIHSLGFRYIFDISCSSSSWMIDLNLKVLQRSDAFRKYKGTSKILYNLSGAL